MEPFVDELSLLQQLLKSKMFKWFNRTSCDKRHNCRQRTQVYRQDNNEIDLELWKRKTEI